MPAPPTQFPDSPGLPRVIPRRRLAGRGDLHARRTLRAAALASGALTAAVGLAACNGSPYAASVNGQVISVASLNHQLAEWASNSTYVSDVDKANSTAQGGSGVGVLGAGGPGTYSSAFVANILGYNVNFDILAQRLSATHQLPGQDVLEAARAVNESQASYWSDFPASLRSFLVDDLAYEAALVPSSASASALQSSYAKVEPYLFSQLCLRQATATTLAAAENLSSGGFVGSVSCYDQAGVEAQTPAWQTAALKLAVNGDVSAPVKTNYGYVVLERVSRVSPGRTPGVDRVLSLLNAQSEPSQLTAVVKAAHVKVNPAYGTWSNGQITPPAAPKA
ncbi:MAG: hypothetical protein ACP5P1_08025 [Acidimicrobiales bacterium]